MKNTKEKIILAAIRVFSQKNSASMEEIAESINLNRRTLHRYFKSKSELINEIILYASNHCFLKTQESISSSNNPIDQLNNMFISDIDCGYQFRFLYNFRESNQGIEEESSDFKEMMLMFRNLLKTLQTRNLINPKLTLDWVESLYFSTINSAMNLIIKDESRKQKIIEMAWMSYFNGIFNSSNKTLTHLN